MGFTRPPRTSDNMAERSRKRSGWLEKVPNLRRDQSHRYWLGNEVIGVSTTGVCGYGMSDFKRRNIEATRYVWEPRGVNTHLALQLDLEARFHPSYAARRRAVEERLTLGAQLEPYADHIAPLVTHPLWDEVEVVATEFMLASRAKNVAGTFDGAYRVEDATKPDGYCWTIFDLKTQSKGGKPYSVRSQLGCYISLASDLGLRFDKALAIWSRPGEAKLQPYTAEECLEAWGKTWDEYCAAERLV